MPIEIVPGEVTFKEAIIAENTFQMWSHMTARSGMLPLIMVASVDQGNGPTLVVVPNESPMTREVMVKLVRAALAVLEDPTAKGFSRDGTLM